MDVVTLEVSVILPVSDAHALPPAAIASIGEDPGLEILVIDGGSGGDSDGAPEWLLAAARRDPRLRLVPGPARGLNAQRNLGVAEAEAPLVAFLDPDQRWAPGKLALQLALHRIHPELGFSFAARAGRGAARTGSGAAEADRATRLLGADALPQIFTREPIELSTVVARTALLRAVGGFTEDAGEAAPWDLWLHLAQCAPVGWLAQPLAEGPLAPRGPRRLAAERRVAHLWHRVVAGIDPAAADAGLARLLADSAAAAQAEGETWAALRFRLDRLLLRARLGLAAPRSTQAASGGG